MEPTTPESPIDGDFLATLVCPLTRQPLRVASAIELAQLKLEAALVRMDGKVAFPIREGFPVLLPDAAIPLL